ncbi:hypothetical protein K1T34_05685 [Amycolatopsis sp. DSM 110486]|nr:hypothetical protein K1T34_05685 [Amycolatopsis sp. DSM 110486]
MRCGGVKPSRGRWPDGGVAPISATLDSTGVIARSVEDRPLVDSVVTATALRPGAGRRQGRPVRVRAQATARRRRSRGHAAVRPGSRETRGRRRPARRD